MPGFSPVAKRQLVERDIAVVVAERVSHDEVMRAIGGALAGDLLRSAVLFDVFRPQPQRAGEAVPAGALAQGEKSLAIRLTLGSDAAALTDAEIEAAVQSVLQALGTHTERGCDDSGDGAGAGGVRRRKPGIACADQSAAADLLFEHIGLNKRESKDMVDAFFDLIVPPGRRPGREAVRV